MLLLVISAVLIFLPCRVNSKEGTADEKRLLLANDPNTVQIQLDAIRKELDALRAQRTCNGAVYTVWGRKTCSNLNGTETVYSGIAAGGHYIEKGNGDNVLCLPHDPESLPPDFGVNHDDRDTGHIFGAEYQLNYKNIAYDDDVPCAVCRVRIASSVLMIAGKLTCPKDWVVQYQGFLTSQRYNYNSPRDYVCVHLNAEYFEGTRADNDDGLLFFPVRAKCGSLPCPPYKDSQYMPCVVCSA